MQLTATMQLNLLGYNFEYLGKGKKNLFIFKLRLGASVSRSVCPVRPVCPTQTLEKLRNVIQAGQNQRV